MDHWIRLGNKEYILESRKFLWLWCMRASGVRITEAEIDLSLVHFILYIYVRAGSTLTLSSKRPFV